MGNKAKLLKKLQNASRVNRLVSVVVVFGVAGVGLYLITTFAATLFGSVEPENATLSGATKVSDASASGGFALQFGSGSTPAGTKSSIEQYGITWTFDKAYPAGQFVNGDWWVVGPVNVVSMSPVWDGTRHGAMVNPRPSESHGYYNGVHGYRAELNVADEVAAGTDLSLSPGSSLISTRGWNSTEAGSPPTNGSIEGVPRPALKDAAVLTVLDSAPSNGSFRPPFGYGDKPLYNISQIQWNLLPQLTPPTGAPSIASLVPSMQRVRIDHRPNWVGTQYVAPSNNYPGYGREFATEVNAAILALMFNAPQSEKQQLMYNTLQVGIDLHGIIQHTDGVLDKDAWYGNYGGGHGQGRKWPILFAGMMLNDTEMKSIGTTYGRVKWQEDCQTFYNTDPYGNNPRPIGSATWADRQCIRSNNPDGYVFDNSYRLCCTGNSWVGTALGVHIMGAKELWNYNAFFDYMDWYVTEPHSSTTHDSTSQWQKRMWDMYRSQY